MTFEITNGKPLRRNPSSRTGVSIRDGIAIESLDELPDHAIEVHVFGSAGEASIFVSGMETVGLGNAMAYDWDHGDLGDNRVVVVARLDRPRPEGERLEDVVPILRPRAVHAIDTAARKAATEGELERARLQRAADRAEREDVEAVVVRAGGVVDGSGARWFHFSIGDCHGTVSWKGNGDVVRVVVGISGVFGNSPLFADELREACERMALEDGVRFEDDELILDRVQRTDVALAAARLGDIEQRLIGMTSVIAERRFEEGFPLTPKRVRFLEAAIAEGVHVHHGARGRSRARAGGVELMWSEFQGMIRRGWIEKRSHLDHVVTPLGRTAVTERETVPAPRP